MGNQLINAYRQMIDTAHAHGILVYGATLLPMGGSSYYSTAHEAERQIVNQWIRTSGAFDAVIDFDVAMRDSSNPINLRPDGDSGDHLHPNEAGHRMMGEAVDLNLFAGGGATGVDDAKEAPEGFELRQNYPNPFNPTTNVRFEVGGLGFVSLKVFDLLGREVATLVNEVKQPGEYAIQWDADGFASGVYLYRLRVGSFVETRKLVVQR